MYNGSQTQLSGFRSRARVSFPLLKRAAGGQRTFKLGDLIVADRKGIVRYLGKIERASHLKRAQETVTLLLNEKPVVAPITQPITFEEVYVGDNKTTQINISNTGNATLEITGFQTEVAHLNATLPLTVPAGESRNIDVMFMPTETGSFSGIIQFTTNADPFSVTLAPTSVQPPPIPAIEIGQTTLTFGTFDQNTSPEQTVVIQNIGTAPLNITNIRSDIPNLTLSTTQLTLAPNSSETITLTHNNDTPGPFAGTLEILSDDPNKPTLTIPLSGDLQIITPTLNADFNSDGKVDFTDFLSFAIAYGSTDSKFDLNKSGQVDFPDFLAFTQSFGKSLN